MKKILRFTIASVTLTLLIVFLPYLFSRVMSGSRQIKIAQTPLAQQAPATGGDSITIAQYNIAHGRGLERKNWNGENKATRFARLDQLADVIKKTNADIVVLNEVDFNSSWSHRINQAKYLAEKAEYRWRAEERNMDFQLGWLHWKFGNAVLSKHPIERIETIDLPALKEWENILVGKKRGLLANIRIDGDRINVAAVHLSHRSEDLRVDSARQLIKLANKSPAPFIVAGDLNSTPPKFPRSKLSATGENTIDLFIQEQLFHHFPGEQLDSTLMSHPADNPQKKIDWILIPKSFQFESYQVLRNTLSDHLPVVARIKKRRN